MSEISKRKKFKIYNTVVIDRPVDKKASRKCHSKSIEKENI